MYIAFPFSLVILNVDAGVTTFADHRAIRLADESHRSVHTFMGKWYSRVRKVLARSNLFALPTAGMG